VSYPVSQKPIFIGGLIKSGTSLLRAMLGQHSQISSGLETYWFDMNWKAKSRDQLTETGLPTRYEDSLDQQLERIGGFFDIKQDELKLIKTLSDSPENFLDRLMVSYSKNLNKQRWVEKTPGNILHIPRILKYWPTAQFLVCARSPLDVYSSCLEAGRWNDVETFVGLWRRYYEAFNDATQQGYLAKKNVMLIHYEHLTEDPSSLFQKICSFLDLPFQEDMSKYKGQSDDYKKVLAITGKRSTTLERMKYPLLKDRIDIYKRVVPETDIIKINELMKNSSALDLWAKFLEWRVAK
jgi:hypothetical protein